MSRASSGTLIPGGNAALAVTAILSATGSVTSNDVSGDAALAVTAF